VAFRTAREAREPDVKQGSRTPAQHLRACLSGAVCLGSSEARGKGLALRSWHQKDEGPRNPVSSNLVSETRKWGKPPGASIRVACPGMWGGNDGLFECIAGTLPQKPVFAQSVPLSMTTTTLI
jgi:hypothetical protein